MAKKKRRLHRRRTYTNLLLAGIGIIVAFALAGFEPFQTFLFSLGKFEYVGAFIAGILFVSTFTAATGVLILLILAQRLIHIQMGLVAGMGAVVGDLIIFSFIRDGLLTEIEDLYDQLGGRRVTHVFRTKAFRWTLPLIGAIIIASPLPDELGVGLLGASKMKTLPFVLLSFTLNAIGIFLVISASVIIKP